MSRYRTWMFVPGSDEKKLSKAGSLSADVLIYDLEDSVSNHEKEQTRLKVRSAVKTHREKVNYVRINSYHTPYMYKDITDVLCDELSGIVLPKVESPEQISFLDRIIGEFEAKRNLESGRIKILPIIESALGLHHAFEVAVASQRVEHLAFGSMDFALDIQAQLTKEGTELLYARSQLIVVSRAAGINAPIDTVYINFKDREGFLKEVVHIKQLGFQGKLLIHPHQIEPLNQVFAPTQEEIEKAEKVVEAFDLSLSKGEGVLQIDGKMIDLPIVEHARKTLDAARIYSK